MSTFYFGLWAWGRSHASSVCDYHRKRSSWKSWGILQERSSKRSRIRIQLLQDTSAQIEIWRGIKSGIRSLLRRSLQPFSEAGWSAVLDTKHNVKPKRRPFQLWKINSQPLHKQNSIEFITSQTASWRQQRKQWTNLRTFPDGSTSIEIVPILWSPHLHQQSNQQ